MPYFVRILEIFESVETEQMRSLFSFLSDEEFGKIIAALQLQGMVYFSPDTKVMAINQLSLESSDVATKINCFCAFDYLKEKMNDFKKGSAPSIITFSSDFREYALIPLSEETLDEINENLIEFDASTSNNF